MAQGEERRRRNMSIFRDFSTKQWAILIKSPLSLNWGDAQMASISVRKPLARATSPRGASFGPISSPFGRLDRVVVDRKEHTSELQSLMSISYAVFCLKKKTETHLKTRRYITRNKD